MIIVTVLGLIIVSSFVAAFIQATIEQHQQERRFRLEEERWGRERAE
jgi:hypothetical protein